MKHKKVFVFGIVLLVFAAFLLGEASGLDAQFSESELSGAAVRLSICQF